MYNKIKKLVILLCPLFSMQSFVSAKQIDIGVNAHILNQDQSTVKASVKNTLDIKMKFIRMDLPWKYIETQKGRLQIPKNINDKINILLENNITPIIILDYGNKFYDNGNKPLDSDSIKAFANYAAFVVNYYKGKISYYQIWNEWDGKLGNTTPGKVSDYKNLVKETYKIIKKTDPKSNVITSSFSAAAFNKTLGIDSRNYINDFMTDDMSNYTDIIAIHPYTTYRKGLFSNYSFYKRQIQYTMNMIKNSNFRNKPVFITEIGWSTSSTPEGVSDNEQKANIIQSICDAQSVGISAIIIYELNDASKDIHDTESGFGLIRKDGTYKPSYQGLKKLSCE